MDNGASSYRRFLQGDENGFIEIVRDYKDGLILYLSGIVGSVSLAEELAEDAFVRLGIKKPRFSGNSSFKTWLYAIGRNLALDLLRKTKRRGEIPLEALAEPAEEAALETLVLQTERKIALHGALGMLKEEYRQVLYLSYFEGFSARECAKILRKSVHGTEVLLSRARKALKEELIREGYHDEDL